MTIFLETSAIVSILTDESDATDLANKLALAAPVMTGAHVLVEGAMVLSSRMQVEPIEALDVIDRLLEQSRATVVPLTTDIARAAVDAYARYGKGRGHPAQLNFGDCLSYGCAKVHGVPLLFKGDDFAQTDVARA